MNIWLPIITNLVLAGILTAGFFIGKKNGFKLQLAKLLTVLPLMVGCYFLAPSIVNLLPTFNIAYSHEIVYSAVLLVSYGIVYGLTNIVIALVRKAYEVKHGLSTAKSVKVKGLDRKATKELKKEQKELEKLNKPQLSKTSKTAGIIMSMILAIVSSFILFMPIKFAFKSVAVKHPELTQIEKGYEYTPYGQLDKVIELSNYIIKK